MPFLKSHVKNKNFVGLKSNGQNFFWATSLLLSAAGDALQISHFSKLRFDAYRPISAHTKARFVRNCSAIKFRMQLMHRTNDSWDSEHMPLTLAMSRG